MGCTEQSCPEHGPALRAARKQGFDEGFQLAAQVEQRRAKELLAQYALDVLGKDRADGAVD